MQLRKTILIGAFFLVLLTSRGDSQSFLVGVRGGASLDCDPGQFRQAETFAIWNVPCQWNSDSKLSLLPQLETSVDWSPQMPHATELRDRYARPCHHSIPAARFHLLAPIQKARQVSPQHVSVKWF